MNAFTSVRPKAEPKPAKAPRPYHRNMPEIALKGSRPQKDCLPNCDYSKAQLKGRATWCCAKCGRDFSLEYLFWYEATHPDWKEKESKKDNLSYLRAKLQEKGVK